MISRGICLYVLFAALPCAFCAPHGHGLEGFGDLLQQEGQLLQEAGTIAKALANATSDNAIVNNQTCKPMTVIFARGTAEIGNVGILAGPPFFSALDMAISTGNVAVQGVDYPASVSGFLAGGDEQGSQTMASLVNRSLAQCPNSKIVLSGYSQGGQLVHKAANDLGSKMSSVNSVVIFGDPLNGTAVANIDPNKVLVICHSDDNICQHGDMITESHLTYGDDATMAATFVMGQSGLGMDSTRTMVKSNMMGVAAGGIGSRN